MNDIYIDGKFEDCTEEGLQELIQQDDQMMRNKDMH